MPDATAALGCDEVAEKFAPFVDRDLCEGRTDLNWQSTYMPALDELLEFERLLRPGGAGR